MAGPQVNDPEEENSDPNKKKLITRSICAYCDRKGHKTTKSKLCLFTSVENSPFYRADNVERSTDALLSSFQGINEEASVSSEPDWESDLEGCTDDENSNLGVFDEQFERQMVDTIDLQQDDVIP